MGRKLAIYMCEDLSLIPQNPSRISVLLHRDGAETGESPEVHRPPSPAHTAANDRDSASNQMEDKDQHPWSRLSSNFHTLVAARTHVHVPGMLACTCNANAWEEEEGGGSQVQGQYGLGKKILCRKQTNQATGKED